MTVISTPKAAVLLADLESGIQLKLWSVGLGFAGSVLSLRLNGVYLVAILTVQTAHNCRRS